MCVLSIKVLIRKKSGTLFNDPRIYIYIYICVCVCVKDVCVYVGIFVTASHQTGLDEYICIYMNIYIYCVCVFVRLYIYVYMYDVMYIKLR